MKPFPERLSEAVGFIKSRHSCTPTIGLILGSGLGGFADALAEATTVPTSTIPNYPVSTVEGHKGKLVFAKVGAKPTLAFQGRVHFYESENIESVLFPIRVAHALEIRNLIITNAAGGINRTFKPGDLMVIADQIHLTSIQFPFPEFQQQGRNTLFSKKLIHHALKNGQALGLPLKSGVYVGLKGPSYETAAEIEMLSRIGGDAVGMSTVLEVECAAALGMEVLGISCITNLATGITGAKLSHAEVTEVGISVRHKFGELVSSIITGLP